MSRRIGASAIRSGVLAGQIVLFYDCWDCAAGMVVGRSSARTARDDA